MTEVSDTLTIALRKPISYPPDVPNGITYSELRLREPTAGEWVEWSKLAGTPADLKAIGLVAGVPPEALSKLGARDFRAACDFIKGYLSGDDGEDAKDPPENIAIPLRKAIEWGGNVLTELVLHEPLADEIGKWDNFSGPEADVVAVSAVTGLDRLLINQVPVSELRAAARYIAGFFAQAPSSPEAS